MLELSNATSVNNINFINFMEQQEKLKENDNDKSKSLLEREQTAPMRK